MTAIDPNTEAPAGPGRARPRGVLQIVNTVLLVLVLACSGYTTYSVYRAQSALADWAEQMGSIGQEMGTTPDDDNGFCLGPEGYESC